MKLFAKNPNVRAKPAARACDLCRRLKIRCLASPTGCKSCQVRKQECTYRDPSKRSSTSPSCDSLGQDLLMRHLTHNDITHPEITFIANYFDTIYPKLTATACISPHDLRTILAEASPQEFAITRHLLVAIFGFYLDLANPIPSDNTIKNYDAATALIPHLNPSSKVAPLIQASLRQAFQCATFFTQHL
ncbi:Gypsy retrotransposon integrase-like protein 1 [Entomophthora muscae]|uniref:Gypsy retrotransposon integrase-like protein 1 n=1 Tax=Entomophthora muscae TaxID=34485 RepID=A0ACC2RHB7_9FUNG|nr:Gypsy retrotransposon integrase-like protein 1 [Entomophthora muscae]